MSTQHDIIRAWCASCGMPEPSNGDCMALVAALTPPDQSGAGGWAAFPAERFMLDAHIDGMDQLAEFVLAKDHDRIVHDLETICDPAGLVRENAQLRDTNEALQKMYRSAVDAPAASAAPPQSADDQAQDD